jgi:hypothetical protein
VQSEQQGKQRRRSLSGGWRRKPLAAIQQRKQKAVVEGVKQRKIIKGVVNVKTHMRSSESDLLSVIFRYLAAPPWSV